MTILIKSPVAEKKNGPGQQLSSAHFGYNSLVVDSVRPGMERVNPKFLLKLAKTKNGG